MTIDAVRRRRAGDVQRRQRDPLPDVIGEHGERARLEQYGRALDGDLAVAHVDVQHPVEPQRRQRQRDQAGDPLPGPHVARLPDEAADLGHGADQHPARPGHRVVHLAPLGHDPLDLAGDPRRVAAGLLAQLAEGGRVEVQALHANQHLGVRDPGVVVQPLRGLREHARAVEHAVQAVAGGSTQGHDGPASGVTGRPYRRRGGREELDMQDRCAGSSLVTCTTATASRSRSSRPPPPWARRRCGRAATASTARRAACSGWRCSTTTPTTWRRATCC